jgi:uncharacterized protein YndB with AHSA1/START domain
MMIPESGANGVMIRRRLHATREELFDAWTDAEGMRAWMCPGSILSVEVRMEPRVGGALLIVMRDANKTYEHRGEFIIVDRPAKLSFTWIAAATDQQPTLVTVEFLPINDSETELVLTHERFPDREASEQYRGGWGQIVGRLDVYLRKLEQRKDVKKL